MVQMQNLKSQMADSVLASGKSDKKTAAASDKSSDFMNMLQSSQQTTQSKPESKSDKISDTKSEPDKQITKPDSPEDKVTAEAQTNTSQSKDSTDNETNNAGAEILTAEMLTIINAQQTQTSAENVPVQPTEVLTTAAADTAVQGTPVQSTAAEVQSGVLEMMQAASGQVQKQTAEQSTAQPEVSGGIAEAENTQTQVNAKGFSAGSDSGNEQNADSDAQTKNAQTVQNSGTKDTAPELVQQTAAQTQTFTEFNAETVKVSDGAQLTQQTVTETADTIVAKITEGTQEFEITLNPESLGKVEIKLVFENGRAQVFMHCSESSTQKAMMANAEVIRQIIETNTNQQTQVAFTEANDKMGNYEDQSNKGGNGSQSQSGRDENAEDTDAASFIQQLRLGLIQQEEV